MRFFKSWIGSLLGLTLLAGCGSAPVLKMTRPDYPKSPVYVDNLSFEKFKCPEKWESQQEWVKHVEAWQKTFRKTINARLPEAKPLEAGVKEGLIVKTQVVNIQRNFNVMWGGLDTMSLEAELLNAATHEKVGEMKYVSDSSGVGPSGYTFGGRMGFCAENAAVLLVKALKKR